MRNLPLRPRGGSERAEESRGRRGPCRDGGGIEEAAPADAPVAV